jgi:hypothetical protein
MEGSKCREKEQVGQSWMKKKAVNDDDDHEKAEEETKIHGMRLLAEVPE